MRYTTKHRDLAIATFKKELKHFSFDGLTTLQDDLEQRAVVRGSWGGCPISYRDGAPGRSRRDLLGRARNAFTVHWDNYWLQEKDILPLVKAEIARRLGSLALSAPQKEEVGVQEARGLKNEPLFL